MSQLLEEILSQDNMILAYKKVKANRGTSGIDGIGVDEIDEFTTVGDEEAIETARRLASEFGLFSGISTGANVAAALKIAAKMPEDSAVVTVQPDRGDKYLSVFTR